MNGAEYTIRFWRSKQWSKRFRQAGIHKPAGYTTSDERYADPEKARETVNHVNAEKPVYPAEIVLLSGGFEHRLR